MVPWPGAAEQGNRGHPVAVAHESAGDGDDLFSGIDAFADFRLAVGLQPDGDGPGFDDAVTHHLDDGAFGAVEHGRERHQGAVAAVDLDGAAREGADGEAGDGIDRQADAAKPGGAVHFRRDQPDAGGHRLFHAGRADQGRLTDAETGERDFRHVGFDFDGAAADDAEQRFGGGGHQRAQAGLRAGLSCRRPEP